MITKELRSEILRAVESAPEHILNDLVSLLRMPNGNGPRTIGSLLGHKFLIPSYQRGYRWTPQQVIDLLDDLWEFTNKPNKNEDEWYCLQPVVVKKSSDETDRKNGLDGQWYDVIDGQQRLTTTFIILKYLESLIATDPNNFRLKYETREGSTEFLVGIKEKTEDDSKKYVDYHHIFEAYRAIVTWFDDKEKTGAGQGSIKPKIITVLLEKLKVIWYEIPTAEDSIDIFTRINSGKIPLTNAELIKALFLKSSNFNTDDPGRLRLKQLEIASEWDGIESRLQDESFWLFINKEEIKENNLATRIELIFDLIAEPKAGSAPNATFRFFQGKLGEQSEAQISSNWQEVKKLYQMLEEWYNDRELYHKVGYLITTGFALQKIVEEKKNKTQSGFRSWLNEEIHRSIAGLDLGSMEYGHKKVRDVLLLHNIQTMLKNENETNRFPFNRFKDEFWDVEHIHAIATEVKVKKEDQKDWLKNNFVKTEHHRNQELNSNIEMILSCPDDVEIEDDKFSIIVEYVLGEEDNGIRNLCLLDRSTNRSYKNDSFKNKRGKIVERETQGTFIPLCTKNVFMKYYSTDAKDLELWNEKDREAYLNGMKGVIASIRHQTIPSTK